jgi:hypothetical protein
MPPSRTLTTERPSAPSAAGPSEGRPPLPLWALILTGLVVGGALVPVPVLREVVSGEPLSGMRLEHDLGYLVFAPLYGIWDRLGVLALSTHVVLLLTLIGVFLGWRLLRRRTPRGIVVRIAVEGGVAALALAGLLAFYAGGALLTRPMGALVVDDPGLLVIDLHSHTERSHDGRARFSAERNREWHASAGFHAVLVTDHYNWGGFQDAVPGNPSRAGLGTTLLEGAELKLFGKHTNVVGDSMRYRPFLDDTGRNLKPEELEAAIRRGEVPPPTFLMALPVDLSDFQGYSPATPLGLIALEVNDASPRGMEQSLRDRDLLLQIADSLDLAIFAGSNNHGWGRTSVAWNLMRMEDWRELGPGDLVHRVEADLHLLRREAVTVVERAVPWHGGNRIILALAAPHVGVHLFRTLSPGERVSWVLWIWLLAGLSMWRRRSSASGEGAGALG